jgi:integrase
VSRPTTRFFCTGTNRFGRPCNNRVAVDGESCGRCSPHATLPTPTAPATPAVTDAGDEWTLAPKLQDRLAPLAENNPTLQRLVDVCVRLARNSRAEGSKAVYDQHWRTFRAFCDTVGLSPELPVPAETTACFLAWLADAGRIDRTTGTREGTGEPLRHGYLRQAVAAIGYRHTLEGLTSPTHDPLVQAVLRGYGRIHGNDVRGKDPIRLDDLTHIATTLPRLTPLAARDRALMLLATNPTFGLNAGQLARLDGEHILWPHDPDDPIVLLVHPGGRSLSLDPIDIPPDHATPDSCAARALTDLQPDAFGPVFRSASKQRLSRQAILKILRSAITAAGLTKRTRPDGVPRLDDPGDRARLARHITSPDPADIRDLALILNLYWGAFRGSELCAMRWHDAHIVTHGVEWTVPRAKNDQLGRGETVGAARNPNPLLCPATALDTWHTTLTDLLGRQPHTDEPVFVRLDHPLDAPEAITRDGASQIVKRATRAAGLIGDYASHSLRAGFVSDALDAGATREQVQHHGRWNNITSIDPYYRKTLTWGRTNPSQHLATATDQPKDPSRNRL